MWNPLSWVMEAAAVMAIILANGGVSIVPTTLFFTSDGENDLFVPFGCNEYMHQICNIPTSYV